MPIATYGLIFLSVTMSALAQTSFKFGMGTEGRAFATALLSPGVIAGLAMYGAGTLIWLRVLARVDLSQAYPFVGVGFVMTALIGALFFGEVVTTARWAGIVLVILGVIVIARS